jgi:SAM-dependent methyltransferase
MESADPPPPERPRRLGAETARSHARRQAEGFYARYLSGAHVLDIGYRGGKQDAEPVTAAAIGVELDYPGYDGVRLPFDDFSQDAVFASHCLEHIPDWQTVLADWFRVLKVGGYLVVAVPHQDLYERRADLPSRFNGNHQRFYTPRVLMEQVETALPVGAWRLRSLRDADDGFRYDLPADSHPKGCYEIEMVVQKITPPAYAHKLRPKPGAEDLVRHYAAMIVRAAAAHAAGKKDAVALIQAALEGQPLPHFRQLERYFPPGAARPDLIAVLRPLLARAPFDAEDYVARYADVREALAAGTLRSAHAHYLGAYFDGRFAEPVPDIFN